MAARPWWRDRTFLLALGAVLLLGAALRLYHLGLVPPGLAYDEAWEGLDGARILAGARPLFLPDNNGREPAFAYSVALTIGLLGQTPTAIRLAAALWGIGTIPAMAVLGGVLGGRRLALATAATVALSYWPVHLSRVGLRPVALPPLEAIGLGLLLWAIGATPIHSTAAARGRWLAALGSGIALGLALYTYLPARLAFVVAAFAVAARLSFVAWRRAWCCARQIVATALVVAVVAFAVAAPLGLHYLRHPEDWLGRADQVSVMNAIRTGADPVDVLGGNLRATLGALAFTGDAQARHDLPGRPMLDLWSALFFLAGLALAPRRLGAVAALTILLWLAAMLVPAVLSDSAPHFLRAVGALPPIYLLNAVGLVWAAEVAPGWLRRRPRWAYGLAALPLLATGFLTSRDYFVRFADPAVSSAPFEADVGQIAAALNVEGGLPDAQVGPIEPEHPALRFLVRGAPPATFPVAALPLLPAEGGPVDYFVRTSLSGETLARLRAAFPTAEVEPQSAFTRVRVPIGTRPQSPSPRTTVGANFGPIELVGADADSALAGAELPLRLYWRVTRPIDERLTVFVHLVDTDGRVWAQEDLEPGAGGYPTAGWRAGEVVLDERWLPLAPGIPPGSYALRVGLVRAGGARLPLVGASGDFATVAPVAVERGAGRLNLWRLTLPERPERDLVVGDARVRLVGFRIERATVDAGQPLPLLLAWEWRGPAPSARLDIGLGPADRPIAGREEPLGGAWPSDRWSAGEFLQQRIEVAVPASAPSGAAALWLRLRAADGRASEVVPLGQVAIESRARDFTPPSPSHPIGARFGDFAELVGYDAASERARPGDTIRVKLYWRALATPADDYVVFLHLLGADERVRGQVDAPPGGGRSPTRTWLLGETIVDERAFSVAGDAPTGSYRFEVGLYKPENGARVPLTAGGTGDRIVFGSLNVQP